MNKFLLISFIISTLALIGCGEVVVTDMSEKEIHSFINPSKESLDEELLGFIENTLPEGSAILFARRSTPHPQFENYSTCFLAQLPPVKFDSFVESASIAEPQNTDIMCSDEIGFKKVFAKYEFENRANWQGTKSAEFFNLAIDIENRIVLISMGAQKNKKVQKEIP